ncbi:hypothetical protein ATANTOWER_028412 [Ataeniobius toweri]|uniref:Uncharacterized protein n=1 Tax=Ataeniobius toweri TaxID=208326 RepID=A0ABU7A8C5_9TELE|nr:hypothetical protein [Ataeniobius toweri]
MSFKVESNYMQHADCISDRIWVTEAISSQGSVEGAKLSSLIQQHRSSQYLNHVYSTPRMSDIYHILANETSFKSSFRNGAFIWISDSRCQDNVILTLEKPIYNNAPQWA